MCVWICILEGPLLKVHKETKTGDFSEGVKNCNINLFIPDHQYRLLYCLEFDLLVLKQFFFTLSCQKKLLVVFKKAVKTALFAGDIYSWVKSQNFMFGAPHSCLVG